MLLLRTQSHKEAPWFI